MNNTDQTVPLLMILILAIVITLALVAAISQSRSKSRAYLRDEQYITGCGARPSAESMYDLLVYVDDITHRLARPMAYSILADHIHLFADAPSSRLGEDLVPRLNSLLTKAVRSSSIGLTKALLDLLPKIGDRASLQAIEFSLLRVHNSALAAEMREQAIESRDRLAARLESERVTNNLLRPASLDDAEAGSYLLRPAHDRARDDNLLHVPAIEATDRSHVS